MRGMESSYEAISQGCLCWSDQCLVKMADLDPRLFRASSYPHLGGELKRLDSGDE